MERYRLEGIGNNKKIKKERNKPLPIELMKNEKFKRIRTNNDGNTKNPFDSEIV